MCNQIKMRLYWIRVDPNPMTGGLITRKNFGHRDRDTQGECHVTMEGEIGIYKPRNTKDCGHPPESRKR